MVAGRQHGFSSSKQVHACAQTRPRPSPCNGVRPCTPAHLDGARGQLACRCACECTDPPAGSSSSICGRSQGCAGAGCMVLRTGVSAASTWFDKHFLPPAWTPREGPRRHAWQLHNRWKAHRRATRNVQEAVRSSCVFQSEDGARNIRALRELRAPFLSHTLPPAHTTPRHRPTWVSISTGEKTDATSPCITVCLRPSNRCASTIRPLPDTS